MLQFLLFQATSESYNANSQSFSCIEIPIPLPEEFGEKEKEEKKTRGVLDKLIYVQPHSSGNRLSACILDVPVPADPLRGRLSWRPDCTSNAVHGLLTASNVCR
jgi:hypothetical protein